MKKIQRMATVSKVQILSESVLAEIMHRNSCINCTTKLIINLCLTSIYNLKFLKDSVRQYFSRKRSYCDSGII
jgi:hypothetical protein